jgi:hypothetical protein
MRRPWPSSVGRPASPVPWQVGLPRQWQNRDGSQRPKPTRSPDLIPSGRLVEHELGDPQFVRCASFPSVARQPLVGRKHNVSTGSRRQVADDRCFDVDRWHEGDDLISPFRSCTSWYLWRSTVRAHLRRRIPFPCAPPSGAARCSAACLAFGRTALAGENCSSSTGAPSSTMNATRTPTDGSFGAIKISLPRRASSKSSTAKAMCGTVLTISGTSQCGSNRIHSIRRDWSQNR